MTLGSIEIKKSHIQYIQEVRISVGVWWDSPGAVPGTRELLTQTLAKISVPLEATRFSKNTVMSGPPACLVQSSISALVA